jgi:hypothetical protein
MVLEYHTSVIYVSPTVLYIFSLSNAAAFISKYKWHINLPPYLTS